MWNNKRLGRSTCGNDRRTDVRKMCFRFRSIMDNGFTLTYFGSIGQSGKDSQRVSQQLLRITLVVSWGQTELWFVSGLSKPCDGGRIDRRKVNVGAWVHVRVGLSPPLLTLSKLCTYHIFLVANKACFFPHNGCISRSLCEASALCRRSHLLAFLLHPHARWVVGCLGRDRGSGSSLAVTFGLGRGVVGSPCI